MFVTGAGGFVGRHVLARIDPDRFDDIRLLTRSDVPLPPRLADSDRVRRIPADLGRPERYAGALDPDTVVLHLAARTGSARPQEYDRDNVGGTLSLLEAAETRDVAGLVHVSTIAVHVPEHAHYPYAESKRAAEALVRDFPCPWTIVRPTVVLARDAPNWARLAQLATGPAVLVPGAGTPRMQPIHADDLADVLLEVSAAGAFDRRAHDLGGPDVLTVEDFLRRVHRRARRRRGPAIRAPIRLGIPLLRAAERLSPVPLPVTEGQLSTFLYDGIAAEDGFQEVHRHRLRGVEEILDDLLPPRA